MTTILPLISDEECLGVLIVSDNKSASKYQADKYKNNPNVVQLSAKEALGGEYAYVFMDVEFEDDLFAELKKFYMLSQRANIYSAILDEENNYGGKLKIQTKNNPLSNAFFIPLPISFSFLYLYAVSINLTPFFIAS